MSHRHAHIDTALLQQEAVLPWSNLGLWNNNQPNTYTQAATRLAQNLATQSGLKAGDTVLDVGCGYGASLLLWQQLGASSIVGVEQQTACVQHINAHSTVTTYQAQMQELTHVLEAATFDVVLAVDVAYQWDLATWLTQAASGLKPSGRVGFHTLLQNPHAWADAQPWHQWLTRQCLQQVGVPHLHTPHSLQAALSADFIDLELENISTEVLQGFGLYAQGLHLEWWRKPLSSLKIALTGVLCRYLHQTALVDYVAISARKR